MTGLRKRLSWPAGGGRRATLVAALGVAVVLAGCGGSTGGNAADAGGEAPARSGVAAPVVESPLADCAELLAPPAQLISPADEPLPDLTLACFTGGEPVPLSELGGPAVVNLWASWCPPCREELPALQRYADRAAGEVAVIGVVTEDRPAAAAALAEQLEITFPALSDPDGELFAAVGGVGLPLTLFVDAAGNLAGVHNAPLDEAGLAEQVADRLGVTVP